MAKKEAKKITLKADFGQMSYIFGIISIVMAIFEPIAGIVFAIIGLVQCKGQTNELFKRAKKLNIIGLIIGIVIIFIVLIVFVISQEMTGISNFPIA